MPPLSDDELATELRQHPESEFLAANRALVGKGLNEAKGTRPWVVASVAPTTDPNLWWVAVIEFGGILVTSDLAHPVSYVGSMLRRCGVNGAQFRRVTSDPAPLNPWTHPMAPARVDRRHVYFAQAIGGGPIKIGVAADVKGRLSSLQTGSPVTLHIKAVIRHAGRAVESELHDRFGHLRSHGEWFKPAPELLAFIEENGVPA